jgi:hypothetical protein
MDSIEQLRKPRWFVRWFSPLRWRFWTLTFPLLTTAAISILFTWPGLTLECRFGGNWFLKREMETWSYKGMELTWDVATLRAGPIQFEKVTMQPTRYTIMREPDGFFTGDEPTRWGAGYRKGDTTLQLTHYLDWRPF